MTDRLNMLLLLQVFWAVSLGISELWSAKERQVWDAERNKLRGDKRVFLTMNLSS